MANFQRILRQIPENGSGNFVSTPVNFMAVDSLYPGFQASALGTMQMLPGP
jgi:hypothetical protein